MGTTRRQLAWKKRGRTHQRLPTALVHTQERSPIQAEDKLPLSLPLLVTIFVTTVSTDGLGWLEHFTWLLSSPQLCVMIVTSWTLRCHIVNTVAALHFWNGIQGHSRRGQLSAFQFSHRPLPLRQIAPYFTSPAQTAQIATSVLDLITARFRPERSHVALSYRATTIVSNKILTLKT